MRVSVTSFTSGVHPNIFRLELQPNHQTQELCDRLAYDASWPHRMPTNPPSSLLTLFLLSLAQLTQVGSGANSSRAAVAASSSAVLHAASVASLIAPARLSS